MSKLTEWPECDDCAAALPRGAWGGAVIVAGWEERWRDVPDGGYMSSRKIWLCPKCCQKEDNGP